MKIKAFILCEEMEYIRKFQKAIIASYSERLSVSFYSDTDLFQNDISRLYPDVIIIGEEYAQHDFAIPNTCGVAYLVSRNNIETLNGKKAIGKYQMVSSICNEFLDLYADIRKRVAETLKASITQKRIVTFLSPAGGVGTSTAAAACARRLAGMGQRVLYLNLELLGNAERFFEGKGSHNLSRVIYALEMANTADTDSAANAASVVKMESALRVDDCGVLFYTACDSPLDMCSLADDNFEQLFEELSKLSDFDWIVTDMDCTLSEQIYHQINRSYATILVSDGAFYTNEKLSKYMSALEILADSDNRIPCERVFVLYNRFSSQNGQTVQNGRFREIGRIHRIMNADDRDISRLIAQSSAFDMLIQ